MENEKNVFSRENAELFVSVYLGVSLFLTYLFAGGRKELVFGIPLEKCLANETDPLSYVDLNSSASNDNLIDALSLSLNETASTRRRSASSLTSLLRNQSVNIGPQQQQQPLVPYIVRACCAHLQNFGELLINFV